MSQSDEDQYGREWFWIKVSCVLFPPLGLAAVGLMVLGTLIGMKLKQEKEEQERLHAEELCAALDEKTK